MKNTSSLPIPLTPKEKHVLDYIESYYLKHGISPTYQEIKDFLNVASFNSVQNYLKQLVDKGYIENPPHQKRAIQLLHHSRSIQDSVLQRVKNENSTSPRAQLLQAHEGVYSLPLLGRVAAGIPLERVEANEYFSVPSAMVAKPEKTFLLKVEGDSMIEDGIFDGDFLLVESTNQFENGNIVVATIEHESTVKRIYKPSSKNTEHSNLFELRPSNSRMTSIWVSPRELEVKGRVISLIRMKL